MDFLTDLFSGPAAWLLSRGLRIVVILLMAWGLLRALRGGLRRMDAYAQSDVGPAELERAKRARTLADMLQSAATLAIVAIATLTILQELEINVLPILTGAGILGLAVGFGAQTLVKDVISGFFIILENQVRVGDTARINGVLGVVEVINLRTILLRDPDGALHVFPCGSVTTLSNRSK